LVLQRWKAIVNRSKFLKLLMEIICRSWKSAKGHAFYNLKIEQRPIQGTSLWDCRKISISNTLKHHLLYFSWQIKRPNFPLGNKYLLRVGNNLSGSTIVSNKLKHQNSWKQTMRIHGSCIMMFNNWNEIHSSIGIWGGVWTLNVQKQKCNNEVKDAY
jgi:hypothetical protein